MAISAAFSIYESLNICELSTLLHADTGSTKKPNVFLRAQLSVEEASSQFGDENRDVLYAEQTIHEIRICSFQRAYRDKSIVQTIQLAFLEQKKSALILFLQI